jgi:Mn-containing catalase
MGKPRFMIGRIPPTPKLVNQFFNDSTGAGEDGEIDARGPWNEGEDWERVEAPAFQDLRQSAGAGNGSSRVDDRSTSTADSPEALEELLVEQLRDLLHAEGQLVKALPRMAEGANSQALRRAFETHLEETKGQVARLQEVFGLVGVPAKGKICKGMKGLIEEGEEVMAEGAEKDPASADLALIAAAQKAEHYEISAYGTARTLAGQAGLPEVAALLCQTLAEEEVTDNLLTQIARELMSEARIGVTKAPKRADVTQE